MPRTIAQGLAGAWHGVISGLHLMAHGNVELEVQEALRSSLFKVANATWEVLFCKEAHARFDNNQETSYTNKLFVPLSGLLGHIPYVDTTRNWAVSQDHIKGHLNNC